MFPCRSDRAGGTILSPIRAIRACQSEPRGRVDKVAGRGSLGSGGEANFASAARGPFYPFVGRGKEKDAMFAKLGPASSSGEPKLPKNSKSLGTCNFMVLASPKNIGAGSGGESGFICPDLPRARPPEWC